MLEYCRRQVAIRRGLRREQSGSALLIDDVTCSPKERVRSLAQDAADDIGAAPAAV